MNFPVLMNELREQRMTPPSGKVRMVLDTDTYNEIDDQFAVTYAMFSEEKLLVEALYAAPFHNDRSSGPADGMEKSYQEILTLLKRMGFKKEDMVFRGASQYLNNVEQAVISDAAEDLVRRALSSPDDSPLYVVAIGAITNVASAILLEPAIIKHIVVVWLGGNPRYWPDGREFNAVQDPLAIRVILDSGVPFVRIPCMGVASHLLTTLYELDSCIGTCGQIGKYLVDIYKEYFDNHFARAKEIWDVAAIAWLINSDWVPSLMMPGLDLTSDFLWKDSQRHSPVREAIFVNRNAVFEDLFQKIQSHV